jgi:hypothetical protein
VLPTALSTALKQPWKQRGSSPGGLLKRQVSGGFPVIVSGVVQA